MSLSKPNACHENESYICMIRRVSSRGALYSLSLALLQRTKFGAAQWEHQLLVLHKNLFDELQSRALATVPAVSRRVESFVLRAWFGARPWVDAMLYSGSPRSCIACSITC